MIVHPPDADYWTAYLATHITEALNTQPLEHARKPLTRAVESFTRSKACSPELRHIINPKGDK